MANILKEREWKLVETCSACPEQYSILDKEGKEIAYLRLRYGYFQAQCPEPGGEVVYDHVFEGDPLKGIFEGREAEYHMPRAIKAVANWWDELAKIT